jgi:thiamine-phosphate pyrophosphorylase
VKRLGHPPFVCLITEGKTTIDNYESQRSAFTSAIREAVSDGVNMVQLRERDLPGRHLFGLARDVVEVLKDTDALVLINDRIDVALAAGADGVHLRESSLDPAVVRSVFPRNLVIGASTHSVEGARAAASAGADFVFFGPVFDSPGKGKAVGVGALREVCLAVGDFPVIALGGIDSTNVDRVLGSGAAGVAGIRSMHEPHLRRQVLNMTRAARLR